MPELLLSRRPPEAAALGAAAGPLSGPLRVRGVVGAEAIANKARDQFGGSLWHNPVAFACPGYYAASERWTARGRSCQDDRSPSCCATSTRPRCSLLEEGSPNRSGVSTPRRSAGNKNGQSENAEEVEVVAGAISVCSTPRNEPRDRAATGTPGRGSTSRSGAQQEPRCNTTSGVMKNVWSKDIDPSELPPAGVASPRHVSPRNNRASVLAAAEYQAGTVDPNVVSSSSLRQEKTTSNNICVTPRQNNISEQDGLGKRDRPEQKGPDEEVGWAARSSSRTSPVCSSSSSRSRVEHVLSTSRDKMSLQFLLKNNCTTSSPSSRRRPANEDLLVHRPRDRTSSARSFDDEIFVHEHDLTGRQSLCTGTTTRSRARRFVGIGAANPSTKGSTSRRQQHLAVPTATRSPPAQHLLRTQHFDAAARDGETSQLPGYKPARPRSVPHLGHCPLQDESLTWQEHQRSAEPPHENTEDPLEEGMVRRERIFPADANPHCRLRDRSANHVMLTELQQYMAARDGAELGVGDTNVLGANNPSTLVLEDRSPGKASSRTSSRATYVGALHEEHAKAGALRRVEKQGSSAGILEVGQQDSVENGITTTGESDDADAKSEKPKARNWVPPGKRISSFAKHLRARTALELKESKQLMPISEHQHTKLQPAASSARRSPTTRSPVTASVLRKPILASSPLRSSGRSRVSEEHQLLDVVLESAPARQPSSYGTLLDLPQRHSHSSVQLNASRDLTQNESSGRSPASSARASSAANANEKNSVLSAGNMKKTNTTITGHRGGTGSVTTSSTSRHKAASSSYILNSLAEMRAAKASSRLTRNSAAAAVSTSGDTLQPPSARGARPTAASETKRSVTSSSARAVAAEEVAVSTNIRASPTSISQALRTPTSTSSAQVLSNLWRCPSVGQQSGGVRRVPSARTPRTVERGPSTRNTPRRVNSALASAKASFSAS
ncbi:unnamed protein product [Amoebophrya sp. A120]|nr:unnamed protein product [Amoebophrya sp. A120]|eukprot:GSA120T00020000001.1